MKKSILFFFLVALVLVSCKKASEKNITEVWELKRITIAGFEIPISTFGTSITMELKDDHTGTYTTADTLSVPIDNWELDKKNQTLSLTMSGTTTTYNIAEFEAKKLMKLEVSIDTLGTAIQEFEIAN
ncbi:MAG: hypothetical protein R2799_00505 [Crocinitomicaceae bacterium]